VILRVDCARAGHAEHRMGGPVSRVWCSRTALATAPFLIGDDLAASKFSRTAGVRGWRGRSISPSWRPPPSQRAPRLRRARSRPRRGLVQRRRARSGGSPSRAAGFKGRRDYGERVRGPKDSRISKAQRAIVVGWAAVRGLAGLAVTSAISLVMVLLTIPPAARWSSTRSCIKCRFPPPSRPAATPPRRDQDSLPSSARSRTAAPASGAPAPAQTLHGS